MPISIEKTSRFLNCREWRSFLSTAQAAASKAQAAASNTSVARALRSGQDWFRGQTWFSERPGRSEVPTRGEVPANAAESLLIETGLVTDSRESLGI